MTGADTAEVQSHDRRRLADTLSDSGLALWEELRESTGRGIAAGMPG